MPNGKKPVAPVQSTPALDYAEICRNCPWHDGIEKTLAIVKEKACGMSKKCDDRRGAMWPHIHSKISKREFWAVLLVFVAILTTIIGFIANGQASYQKDHTVLHREITTDMKDQREKVSDKISEINENVAVLKTLAEKKND
jgi:hypothetical protein